MLSAPAADLNWLKVQPAKPLTFVSSAQLRSGSCPYTVPVSDPRSRLPAAVVDVEAPAAAIDSSFWSPWLQSGLTSSDLESIRPVLQALGYDYSDFEVFLADRLLMGRAEMVASAKSIPFFISARQKAIFLRLLDGTEAPQGDACRPEAERHTGRIQRGPTVALSDKGSDLRGGVKPPSASPSPSHSHEKIKQAWLSDGDEHCPTARPSLRTTASATPPAGLALDASLKKISSESHPKPVRNRGNWRLRKLPLPLRRKASLKGEEANKNSKGRWSTSEVLREILLDLQPQQDRQDLTGQRMSLEGGRRRGKGRGCWSSLCRSPPIFIVLQAAVVLGLALVAASREVSLCSILDGWTDSESMGLETFFVGWTTFRLHDDCNDLRKEFWRWLSYQFSHRGFADLLVNMLQLLIAGVSVELQLGCFKTAAFFNAGIIFGALATALLDAHRQAAGMAGGCYALLGLHFCELSLYWKCRRYPWSKATLLLALMALDCAMNMLYPSRSLSTANATTATVTQSWSARLGGFSIGLLLGTWLLLPLEKAGNSAGDGSKGKGPGQVNDDKDSAHKREGEREEAADVHSDEASEITSATAPRNIVRSRSLKPRPHSVIIQGCLLILGGALFTGGLMWVLQWPPRSLTDDVSWCWARKTSNATLFGTSTWQCIRCSTDACVERWGSMATLASVDVDDCTATFGWGYSEPT